MSVALIELVEMTATLNVVVPTLRQAQDTTLRQAQDTTLRQAQDTTLRHGSGTVNSTTVTVMQTYWTTPFCFSFS